MRRRARVTITDIVVVLVALAGVAAIYPALSGLLSANAGLLGEGEMLAFQTLLPAMLVVLLSYVYLEGVSGRAR